MKVKIYKIYRLICFITNMSYIGQTHNFWRRINQHIKADSYIGKAIRKYELKNFKVEILWITTNKETANCIEKTAIDFYKTKVPDGYNIAAGGEGGDLNSGKTWRWKNGSNAIQNENNPMYGKHHTKKAIEKMKKSHQGLKHSKETKKKMKDSHLGKKNLQHSEFMKENNPMKRPEVVAKIKGEKNVAHRIDVKIKKLKHRIKKLGQD